MDGRYTFTSPRTTEPDPASLLAQLRALDATVGVQHESILPAIYVLKKATAWTAPQIAAAQTVLDTAPDASLRMTAKAEIAAMSIFQQAILLMLLDEINVLRAALPSPLPPVTKQQAFQRALAKADTL
jgi:hypothetical protein